MKRRDFLQRSALASVLAISKPFIAAADSEAVATDPLGSSPESFEFDELTIAEFQDGMKAGRLNARTVTRTYLDRIEDIDKRGPAINSVIELNPEAMAVAEALDRERKEKGTRGPLHGIPILIKD